VICNLHSAELTSKVTGLCSHCGIRPASEISHHVMLHPNAKPKSALVDLPGVLCTQPECRIAHDGDYALIAEDTTGLKEGGGSNH
jgi:hypothetical protein